MRDFKDLKIAVAGTGYVGLSIATLLVVWMMWKRKYTQEIFSRETEWENEK